jgi:hypothetical protein
VAAPAVAVAPAAAPVAAAVSAGCLWLGYLRAFCETILGFISVSCAKLVFIMIYGHCWVNLNPQELAYSPPPPAVGLQYSGRKMTAGGSRGVSRRGVGVCWCGVCLCVDSGRLSIYSVAVEVCQW